LFVNPTPGAVEPTPDPLLVTDNILLDASNISGIFLRQGGGSSLPPCVVDGIKVGTTWASVTPSPKTLTLTAFLEGYTKSDGTVMLHAPTGVTVELHNATTPYALVESQTGSLSTAGVGTFTFTTALDATPYYIVVKTWNTVETWSNTTQSFTAGALSYSFTSGAAQAYQSNMLQIGSKWCIFSGDVTQDGFVNLADYNAVNNDSYNLVSGHVVTDLTGDLYTNLADYNIVNNNSYNLVKARTPLLNPAAGITKPMIRINRQIKSNN
jgi:hypothetical protein